MAASTLKRINTPASAVPAASLMDGDVIATPAGHAERVFHSGRLIFVKRYVQRGVVEDSGATVEQYADPRGRVTVVGRVEHAPAVVGKANVKRPAASGSNDVAERAARATSAKPTCNATKRDGTACTAPATCNGGTRCVGHRGDRAVAQAPAAPVAPASDCDALVEMIQAATLTPAERIRLVRILTA